MRIICSAIAFVAAIAIGAAEGTAEDVPPEIQALQSDVEAFLLHRKLTAKEGSMPEPTSASDMENSERKLPHVSEMDPTEQNRMDPCYDYGENDWDGERWDFEGTVRVGSYPSCCFCGPYRAKAAVDLGVQVTYTTTALPKTGVVGTINYANTHLACPGYPCTSLDCAVGYRITGMTLGDVWRAGSLGWLSAESCHFAKSSYSICHSICRPITDSPSDSPSESPTDSIKPSASPSTAPSVSLQPTCKNGNRGAGCGGDPHFNTFTGKRFSYHGMCDLVLLAIYDFMKNRGLRIHIRTTHDQIKAHVYSFIEVAVLSLGNFVLEVSAEAFHVNNVTNPELPMPMGEGVQLAKFTELIGHLKRTVYEVDMGEAGVIRFTTFKKYVLVSILDASEAEFANSVGMLGTFHEGTFLDRDGLSVIQDVNKFGGAWQVGKDVDDPQLFRETRDPQFPFETCRPAKAANVGRRRLRATGHNDIKEAEEACSFRKEEDFQQCVFDVIATGDIDMAIGGQF